MSLTISVKADIKAATRFLDSLQRQQMPFAIARALTRTAQDAQKEATRQLETKLDRPTPFTKRAIAYDRATKQRLVATVLVKPIQAAYLKWLIEGGTRPTQGTGTGIPTKAARLNQYGNIPNRKGGLIKGKKQFIATIGNTTGVWERVRRELRLIVAIDKDPTYKADQYPFERIVEGVSRSKFRRYMAESLADALRTAR